MEASLGMQLIAELRTGQEVGVGLAALGVHITRIHQHVALPRVLHADACRNIPCATRHLAHRVCGTDSFGSIIIERVANIAIRAGREPYLVEIGPVLSVVLRVGRTCRGVEREFIEETAALLVAVHGAQLCLHVRLSPAMPQAGQRHVGGQVAVGIVLPSAKGGTRGHHMRAAHIDLCIVGDRAIGLGGHGPPFQAEAIVGEQVVLPL